VHLASFLTPSTLIGYGVYALALVLFAECGILLGFFLPGDTLLFSAGLLVGIGKAHSPAIVWLIVLPVAAFLGNVLGYWVGYKGGPAVFNRPQSRIFRPEFVDRTQAFFDRFGRPTIIVARFVPIVRTIATVMAGVGRMRLGAYLVYSVIGAIAWTDGLFLLGYALAHNDFVQTKVAPRIDWIIIGAVLLSIFPMSFHLIRSRRAASRRS
jgi:membrane-associated protein